MIGIAYALIARGDLLRNADLILVGTLYKLAYAATAFYYWCGGHPAARRLRRAVRRGRRGLFRLDGGMLLVFGQEDRSLKSLAAGCRGSTEIHRDFSSAGVFIGFRFHFGLRGLLPMVEAARCRCAQSSNCSSSVFLPERRTNSVRRTRSPESNSTKNARQWLRSFLPGARKNSTILAAGFPRPPSDGSCLQHQNRHPGRITKLIAQDLASTSARVV